MTLPIPATDVVAGPARVWIYSALPGEGSLWTSTDAVQFKRVNVDVLSPSLPPAKAAIAALLLIAPANNDLLYVHLIGKPSLRRISADGKHQTIALAYRRTSERASMTEAQPGIDEEEYSSPVRDIFVPSAKEIVVLRNWEDEPVGSSGPQRFVGRRADLYDAQNGKLIATATFGEPIRWLLRKQGNTIVVLSRSGRLLSGQLSVPVPSAIIK